MKPLGSQYGGKWQPDIWKVCHSRALAEVCAHGSGHVSPVRYTSFLHFFFHLPILLCVWVTALFVTGMSPCVSF